MNKQQVIGNGSWVIEICQELNLAKASDSSLLPMTYHL
jgi:hypothetical protein